MDFNDRFVIFENGENVAEFSSYEQALEYAINSVTSYTSFHRNFFGTSSLPLELEEDIYDGDSLMDSERYAAIGLLTVFENMKILNVEELTYRSCYLLSPSLSMEIGDYFIKAERILKSQQFVISLSSDENELETNFFSSLNYQGERYFKIRFIERNTIQQYVIYLRKKEDLSA